MANNKKNINGIFKTIESIEFTNNNTIVKKQKQFTYNREQLLRKEVADEFNTYANFGIFPTFTDSYPDMWESNPKATTEEEGRWVKINNKTKKVIQVFATKPNGNPPEGYSYVHQNRTKTSKTVDWKKRWTGGAEDKGKAYDPGLGTPGVKSIFNRAGAVIIGVKDFSDNAKYVINLNKFDIDGTTGNGINTWRLSRNVPLLDSPSNRCDIRKNLGCTVKELVDCSEKGQLGLETYAYSDFMYCKHLGKMPNTYMITLRKFPYPVGDYIGGDLWRITNPREFTGVRKGMTAPCVGCMVTWMGVSGNNLNEILRYSYKQPFKEQQAELQDSKSDADSNTTLLNGMFSAFDKSYQKAYAEGKAGEAANAAFSHFGINLGAPPYKEHRNFKDRNKVYGPVDAIKSTYIRSDEGMIFNHKFTLTFEYELRAYNGINPRQAMLDLLSNILNVTYTTGSFWGGGIKGYGAQQSNVFANLNIFKVKGGTFSDYADAFSKDLSNVTNSIKTNLGLNTENISVSAIWNNIKGIFNTLGGMLVGGLLNKMGRPQKAMYNSLLSPAPIGFWHVTIGNPKAPIMSIGNMVITNVTMEHNGPLGLDNFPTGLKVTVELDRGKPRDLRDIEKLYMHGNDRIYSSMTDKVFNMYKHASIYKAATEKFSVVDTNSINFEDKLSDPFQAGVAYDTEGEEQTRKEQTSSGNKNTDTEYKVVKVTTNQDYTFNKDFISGTDADSLIKDLNKYYGTTDIQAVYISATEPEYGSAKPRTQLASREDTIKDGVRTDAPEVNNNEYTVESDVEYTAWETSKQQ